MPDYEDNEAEDSSPIAPAGSIWTQGDASTSQASPGEVEARFQEGAICYFHNDRVVYERLNTLGAQSVPRLLASGVLQTSRSPGVNRPAAFNVPGLLMEYRDVLQTGTE